MRIICPNCDAAYEVSDTLLRPGRPTRCARCEHRWVPLPAPEEAVPPPPEPTPEPPSVVAEAPPEPPPLPPPGPTAMDRLAAVSAVKPEAPWALRLAWAGSAAALLLLAAALYAGRASVMVAWPPSARLYSVLGVAPAADPSHPKPDNKNEGTAHGGETREHSAH